jgi:hypothetical protein
MIDTRIETKHIIAELSVTEKVCLYNALYKDLASKGIGGDTELAHVNMAEMAVLRTMGGAGTLNPDTGLIQFMGGGGSPPPPPPSNTSQSQTSEFPAELKPYIKDVLSKSQAIQEKREAEGYIPYEGPQIAEFTPEQEQAFTGIQGMVGQGQTYFDPSAQLAASSARAPTDQEISGYMSPYMQQVVDIQKREAERQGDVSQQKLATQAVGAGGFGGSRMAILEAEQNRNLQTQLGDIQARGTAAAYEDAQARLAAQRQRELQGSAQFMNLGTTAPQQQLKELTAVEAIGAQKQAQSQQALNIAKDQFGREQTFPEQTLQQYQSVIRGFPLAPSTYTNQQTVTPAPSYLQQAAGLGGLGLGVAGAFGAFKGNSGGLVSRMHGGQVDQNSGLGSIVVKREAGRRVGSNVVLDLAPRPSPRPSPNNILGETEKQRVKRVIGRPDPTTFEEEFPQFKDGKGSRFWRTIGSGTSGVRDFVRDAGIQMGRDVTSLGEYLFGEKGKTPLSLAQIRVVQEVEGNRKDLAQTGVVRESAKKIIQNAEREGIELSPEKLAKTLALDLRPASEVGEEEAARDAQMFPQPESDLARMAAQSKRPPDRVLSDDPRMVASSKQDDYGVGVSGEGGDPLAVARNKLLRQQGASGSTTPNVETSAAPAVASTAPAVASTAPDASENIIIDQDKGAGIGTTRTDAAFKQQVVSLIGTNPAKEDEYTKFSNEFDKMKKQFDDRFEKQKSDKERRKLNLEKSKYLIAAQFGLDLLAQPGGSTFLESVGKAGKDSIPALMKINDKELKLLEDLDNLDFETARDKFGLSKAKYELFRSKRADEREERKLDILDAEKKRELSKIGEGLSLTEVSSYVESATQFPTNFIKTKPFLNFVAAQSDRDARNSLSPFQRTDSGTVQATQSKLLRDASYLAKLTEQFGNKGLNNMTTGAPAGKPPAGESPALPSTRDVLLNLRKKTG